MGQAVRLSEGMVNQAKSISKVFNRSLAGQIEYWAKIGRIAEENPEMNYEFIKNVLIAREEKLNGDFSDYKFDS